MMSREATSPARLKYELQPTQVFVSLSTSLTLVITNPLEGAPVRLSAAAGDGINFTFPAPPAVTGEEALVDSVTFTVSTPTKGFTAGILTGSTFTVSPRGNQTLQPGQTIEVQFDQVRVNNSLGHAEITIAEYIGDSEGSSSVGVDKIAQALNVIAWLRPFVVGLNASSTLYWQSVNGVGVTVFGLAATPAEKNFPVKGDPPYPGNTLVKTLATESQRTFTLQVNTNDGQHRETSVTLTQTAPMITSFAPVDTVPSPLKGDQPVNLAWSTIYASAVFLVTPAGGASRQVALSSANPLAVTPGADAVAGAPDRSSIPSVVTYSLQAQGYQNTATSSVSFALARVNLTYFKYTKRDEKGVLSSVGFLLDPSLWPASLDEGDVNVLTVYQPGGPPADTYYLGASDKTHPQIMYFHAAPVASGGYTLSWVTANLQSLTLAPGDTPVASDKIASGSMTVTPTATTVYVLTGTTADKQTIRSSLTVSV